MKIGTEDEAGYDVLGTTEAKKEADDMVIDHAMAILRERMEEPGVALTKPALVGKFLQLLYAGLEHEVFSITFLDNRHRVIGTETLFRGTIDGAAVFPREVVKCALLKHNAAAAILSHNHPSGIPVPSEKDRQITKNLKDALGTVQIRVLDHIITGGADFYSFAERGLL